MLKKKRNKIWNFESISEILSKGSTNWYYVDFDAKVDISEECANIGKSKT